MINKYILLKRTRLESDLESSSFEQVYLDSSCRSSGVARRRKQTSVQPSILINSGLHSPIGDKQFLEITLKNMRNNTNGNNMESSFYEDSNGQYVPVTTQAQTSAGSNLKRPATLELNSSKSRKARFNASVTAPPVITSPDLQVLKLVSPELEKIIINSAALPTPTPSSILYPTKVRPLPGRAG